MPYVVRAPETKPLTYSALETVCAIGLVFLLLSWLLGGDDFFNDKLLGPYSSGMLVVIIITAMALKHALPHRRKSDLDGSL